MGDIVKLRLKQLKQTGHKCLFYFLLVKILIFKQYLKVLKLENLKENAAITL